MSLPAASAAPQPSTSTKHHISSGAVGGIVTGLGVFLLAVALFFLVCRRRRARNWSYALGGSNIAAPIPPSKFMWAERFTYNPRQPTPPPSSTHDTDSSAPLPTKSDILAADPRMASYLTRPGEGDWGYTAGREPDAVNSMVISALAAIYHSNQFTQPQRLAEEELPRYEK